MNTPARIYIVDHEGMVGAALRRHLLVQGHPTHHTILRSRSQLDLGNQAAVQALLLTERPDQIYLPLPGGVPGPSQREGEHFLAQLHGLSHVIEAAYRARVRRLVFIGSAHIYPLKALVPVAEEDLLSGPLDPRSETLALAQIAAIKLCERISRQPGSAGLPYQYRCLITATAFGAGDDPLRPGAGPVAQLIHRLQRAKMLNEASLQLEPDWPAELELLHTDDIARAASLLMQLDPVAYRTQTPPGIGHSNAGSGRTRALPDLAAHLATLVGYTGSIVPAHASTAQAHPGRLLDSHRMHHWGWRATQDTHDALARTYFDHLADQHSARHLRQAT
jgi:GDP-L-fucose synthase